MLRELWSFDYSRRAMILGAKFGLLGCLLAIVDFLCFMWLGISMTLNNQDVTHWVCIYFAVSFAFFGYLVGLLFETKSSLEKSMEVIQQQFQQLQNAQTKLLEQEKLALVGQMAANVAHEVRNPLGVIKTSATMLLEDYQSDQEEHQMLDFIVQEVSRLNSFCSSLLDFSKPFEVRKEALLLSDFLLELELLGMEASREKEIVFSIETNFQAEELFIHIDKDLFIRIFSNLFWNAIDVLKQGQTFRLRLEKEAQQLCFYVEDTGPGIADDMKNKIFTPFFTTKTKGTGLGLAMSQRIARAHNGELGLEPEAKSFSGGACFCVTLPMEGSFA